MASVNVLNLKGETVSTVELAEAIFGITPNTQAMYDAVVLQRNSLRQGTSKVKDRSEVSGGGKKPWRQKGTGRARQGSIRSPQWRGGGVVFGPTPRSYTTKLNKKVRRLAIRSVLSQKVLDNELVVLENLTVEVPKTKEFVKVLNTLGFDKKTLFIVAPDEDVDNAFLAMRNLGNCLLIGADEINVYDVMNSDVAVFTTAALEFASEVLA